MFSRKIAKTRLLTTQKIKWWSQTDIFNTLYMWPYSHTNLEFLHCHLYLESHLVALLYISFLDDENDNKLI